MRPAPQPDDFLDLLLSVIYDSSELHPEHAADLRRSGITPDTIRLQKIRSVPPDMLDALLGFRAPSVEHAYIIPFADLRGGWMPHIRLKVFSPFTDREGRTVKYLGPKGDPPRLYFTLATLNALISSTDPVWLIEGAKKALAVAQLGLPAVGFEGIQGWHQRGSRDLLPDFQDLRLRGRVVELVPDGDFHTKPAVRRGAEGLAVALAAHGARPRLVALPYEIAA